MSGLKWVTPAIRLTVATSVDDDTPLEIDLTGTIGHKKPVTKTLKPTDVYWLPSGFDTDTAEYRATVVAPPFVRACQNAGFVVLMKEHDRGLPGQRSKTTFVCHRFRFHRTKRSTTTMMPGTRPSQRAVKGRGEETCGFKFNVYFDETRNRWFLPKQQMGSNEHRGHAPLPPDRVKITHRLAPVETTTTTATTARPAGAKRPRKDVEETPDNLPAEDDTGNEPQPTDAYGRLLPLFKDITECIRTEEQVTECRCMMTEIHTKMKAMTQNGSYGEAAHGQAESESQLGNDKGSATEQ